MTAWLAPAGWRDVLARTLITGVAAFFALMMKEWVDGGVDVGACAIDGTWVAAGTFLLNSVFLAGSKSNRANTTKAVNYG